MNADKPEYAAIILGTNGPNLFAYCINNPIMFIDTSGYSIFGDILSIASLIVTIASLCSPAKMYWKLIFAGFAALASAYVAFKEYEAAVKNMN